MEENFKDVIEKIKSEIIDQDITKKYILSIKKVIRELYESCKDEQEESEILQDYLEEYNKELEFRGNTVDIFNKMLMYNAYKRVLQNFKGNKSNFDSVIREAKKRESEDNKSNISLSIDAKEAMVSAVRYAIRTRHTLKEKEILDALQEEKNKTAQYLKEKMIRVIHGSVYLLNEYGFIDEYIEDSNEELQKLGLSQLQFEKRNPIADIQYDENGQVVKDIEDIGVLDTFDKDNLEQLPLEDLIFMTGFWESKYFQERIGLSKAMSTIKTLNLWDALLHKGDEAILDLNPSIIEGAQKKDLALTYLYKNESKITNKMQKQYKKFLEKEGIPENLTLEEEMKSVTSEMSSLENVAKDVSVIECLILHQMLKKESKIKKWGVIGDNQAKKDSEAPKNQAITFAIENKNFRGTLVMAVPKSYFTEFFNMQETELPRYNKEINNMYSIVMSKLYLPTNKYFTNSIQKAYKENPESEFLADLAGKKAQKQTENER